MDMLRALQWPPRNSIQLRLAILVLAVMLPISGIWGWYVLNEYLEAEITSYSKVRAAALRTAAEIEEALASQELILNLLVEEYEVDQNRWRSRFDPDQFLRLHPGVVSMGFYKPSLASRTPGPPASPTVGPRDLQAALHEAWSAAAQSKEQAGVSGAVWQEPAGRWVAVLTRPAAVAPRGEVALVYLSVDLQRWGELTLGGTDAEIIIPVIDRDNRILMRSQEAQTWLGKTLPPAIAEAVAGRQDEVFRSVDLQGVPRFYATSTVRGAGWRVFAGVRESVSLAPARAKATQAATLGFLTLVCLLSGILWSARRIAMPIHDLALDVSRIQDDPSRRVAVVGPVEVQQVGHRLNALLDRIAEQQRERLALEQHYGVIIRHARDIVLLCDENQRLIDFNPAALDAYGYPAEAFRQLKLSELRAPEAPSGIDVDGARATDDNGFLLETVHRRMDGSTFPVEVSSARFELAGRTYIQAFVRDITKRKFMAWALDRKARALRALSACNHALVGATEVQALLDQVCEVLVGVGAYGLAWVGRPLQDAEKHISVWAKAGRHESYLDRLQISWADTPLGRGPTGTAFREQRTVVAHSLQSQSGYEPWRGAALAQGFSSSIALPLKASGRCLGVLTVYSVGMDAFDDAEVELLEDLAGNLAFGVNDLQTREQASQLETELAASERRFRLLIEQAPTGIYVVRHGAFVYANPRMEEILGHTPGELVGLKPTDFVLEEDLHVLTEAHQRMTLLGSTGNLSVRCRRKDGVLIEVGLQDVNAEFEGQMAIIGMAQDISERVRAQAEIQNYVHKLEQTTEATLKAVSNMVEKRDPYTAGHERRVGELAAAIGAEMGLSAHQIKGLRLTGFVHDLGKIAVPAELLAKPTRLTETEMALIRVHSQAGYEVLKDIEFPWPIAEVILQHHERIDGSGYPRGLKGAQILLEARIMMVADVVESMSSHRPYRPGLGIDAALAEITSFSGTRYDPAVVEACRRLFLEKAYRIVA